MPNVNMPTLRKRKDGRYTTKWGGNTFYFGRDRDEARELFAKSLQKWNEWRSNRKPATRAKTFRLVHLAERFLRAKEMETSAHNADYLKTHLRRFLHAWGDMQADEVRVRHLHAVKEDLLRAGYKPKTINHVVGAVKGLLNWGADMEMIPEVSLRGCKPMPLPAPPDKSMSLSEVRHLVQEVAPSQMRPWLAVAYLTGCRPSELVRIVHEMGAWAEEGVFRLAQSKTELRTRQPRHVVFSELALQYLGACEPVWSNPNSFASAFRRSCGSGGPHPLRHSAATHLHQAGVAREDVDLFLGHLPTRVSRTYARIEWQRLREIAAQLKL